ncbi:Methyltransferase domain-containing protein [Halorubrum aquaticum]|uniref:Methyltransferase domain-containing protein n=1 Tax=Halorubrum aquaticum TaxID=387340 RepID=A0A1I3AEX7_9EURY|nr:class I SAM-dependent methyltransferase [Halorubrum aquaticum]SFH48535.1 Methyltransferase domain-containing protein [Halorubrum aquaticum]
MGFHTFDADRAAKLEDPERYAWVSREELIDAVDPAADGTVADLGSGTGFYTDDVAPHAGTVYGVDVQAEMHDRYREKGLPENVELVESDVADLPFDADALDAAFSTMTFHEFADDDAVTELARVLRTGGRLAVFDWSADGAEATGPPLEERYGLGDATAMLEAAGFEVAHGTTRTETFVVVARAP